MELALYHPEHGYYATGTPRTGKSGDFFTSVSVGACFGMLLARHLHEVGELLGERPVRVVEQGANDGQLASDILKEVRHHELEYVIVEPLGNLRAIQEARLGGDVRIVSSLDELGSAPTVYLCNELIDAFPVRRVRLRGGEWHEVHVEEGENGFCQREVPGHCPLPKAGLPEGYTTEVRPAVGKWIADVAKTMDRGVITVIDYGFPQSEYHAPARVDGTLRCYRDHLASEDALIGVGETDITAHVDFTALALAGVDAGLQIEGFVDQARFLVGLGEEWLREVEGVDRADEGTAALVRQFQTLTHPGMMGRVFNVLLLSKNLDGVGSLSGLRHASDWRRTLEL